MAPSAVVVGGVAGCSATHATPTPISAQWPLSANAKSLALVRGSSSSLSDWEVLAERSLDADMIIIIIRAMLMMMNYWIANLMNFSKFCFDNEVKAI